MREIQEKSSKNNLFNMMNKHKTELGIQNTVDNTSSTKMDIGDVFKNALANKEALTQP